VKKSNKNTAIIGELIVAAYGGDKIQVSLKSGKNSGYFL
jgi:hypothetical protein